MNKIEKIHEILFDFWQKMKKDADCDTCKDGCIEETIEQIKSMQHTILSELREKLKDVQAHQFNDLDLYYQVGDIEKLLQG